MKSSTFGLGLNDVWSGLNQWLIPQLLIEEMCDNFCHCRCSRVASAPTQSQSTIWRRTSLHALFGFGPNSGTESGTWELRCTDAKVSVTKTSSFLKRRLSHLTFDQAFWFSSFFFSRRTGKKRKFDGLKNRRSSLLFIWWCIISWSLSVNIIIPQKRKLVNQKVSVSSLPESVVLFKYDCRNPVFFSTPNTRNIRPRHQKNAPTHFYCFVSVVIGATDDKWWNAAEN